MKRSFLGLCLLFIVNNLFAQNTTSYDANTIPVNGSNNVAIGVGTLQANSTGGYNTATGRAALFSNTTGSFNTAYGASVLSGNTTGLLNTAIGYASLNTNITGSQLTVLGVSADVLTDGLTNATAIGYTAIVNQSNAIQLGNSAVTKIFAGVGNTASVITGGLQVTGGSPAVGKVLTSDASGIASWQSPFSWSLTGNAGTVDGTHFIGTTDNVPLTIRVNNQKAGRIETDQTAGNTSFGYQAGDATTTGRRMTATGFRALFSNTTGYANTAMGFGALALNTTGIWNTAVGATSLANNTTGRDNTGIGLDAMFSNSIGSQNTTSGRQSMYYNSTGSANTAAGSTALFSNTTGTGNTAIGAGALYSNTTGDQNTGLGSGANVSTNNLGNATAIGSNTVVNASNKVRIGNSAVTVIEGQVAFTNVSDGRFKNNISEDEVKGLAFITKLRPVVYNFDTKKFQQFLVKNMPDSTRKKYMQQDFGASSYIRQTGFIAQEVEKAAQEAGYDFNGVHKPVDDNDNYGLAYSQFVVPLVKAVQEQQKMIEQQQQQIDELKKMITASPTVATSTVELSDNKVLLSQNVPNPFAQQTRISYAIPGNATSAQMLFYSTDGRLIKTVNISNRGKGQLDVYAADLSAGIYTYSLVIDGKISDTKKLVKQ